MCDFEDDDIEARVINLKIEKHQLQKEITAFKSEKDLRKTVSTTINKLLISINQVEKLVDILDITGLDPYDDDLIKISKLTNKLCRIENELRNQISIDYKGNLEEKW